MTYDDWKTTDPRDLEPEEREEEQEEEQEEEPLDHDPCPECARSFGPHYSGSCNH